MIPRVLTILLFFALASAAAGQMTAFTYQGRLDSSGTPALGLHDFRFSLFTAASGGSQVGVTVCADNVTLSEGHFAATIDFGQRFATRQDRFLEIEVRRDSGLGCNNSTGYTRLSPRQRITAAPMAVHAQSAFTLAAQDGSPVNAVVVDTEGNVGIGTATPGFRLDVRGGPMLVENMGDQADLLWLASERSWVFRQQGAGAGTALKLESVGGGGNKNLIVQTDGFVGIGAASPAAKLDVRGDIRMGGNGELLATGGEENLRIVRGMVNNLGGILAGQGFTVTNPNPGEFIITLATPMSGRMIAVASGITTGYTATCVTTEREIRVQTQFGSNLISAGFHFIATGPR